MYKPIGSRRFPPQPANQIVTHTWNPQKKSQSILITASSRRLSYQKGRSLKNTELLRLVFLLLPGQPLEPFELDISIRKTKTTIETIYGKKPNERVIISPSALLTDTSDWRQLLLKIPRKSLRNDVKMFCNLLNIMDSLNQCTDPWILLKKCSLKKMLGTARIDSYLYPVTLQISQ